MSQKLADGMHESITWHAAPSTAAGRLQLEQDRRHLVEQLSRGICSSGACCTAPNMIQRLGEHDSGACGNVASEVAANSPDGKTLHGPGTA